MKVLHIITGLSTGGAEMMLWRLLSRMDRARFQPHVISLTKATSDGLRVEDLGIQVDCAGISSRPGAPARIWHFGKLVRRIRPDLIQGWLFHGNLSAEVARLSLEVAVPILWNVRYSLHDIRGASRATWILIRLLARLSSRPASIVYNSRVSARQHELIGYDPSRTVIIPNGFDCAIFRPDGAARESVRGELGLSSATPLIGLAARYHPVKDHANFLAAAAALKISHPGAHFVFVGRGADEHNAQLAANIRKLGLEGRVHCLGERADMPRITAALDVATCCSLAEAFPNVLGEAMACGVPSVATDVGDSAWILGETGRIVPPRDPAALCEAWRELLSMGAEERARLGRAARHRIQTNFTLDRIVGVYEDLYERVARGQTDSARSHAPLQSHGSQRDGMEEAHAWRRQA